MENTTRRPLQSYMNKKRYTEINDMFQQLAQVGQLDVERAMSVIEKVLKFDPGDDSYMKRRLELIHKRANAKGVSTYEEMGGRACYERKKQQKKAEESRSSHLKEDLNL